MKYTLIVVGLLFFVGCQDVKLPEMPEDLIPEEKMVEILSEVYLVNAARSIDNRTIIENKLKLDSFIYKKFDIDSLQFVKSNAYYTADLASYDRLFLKVEDRMKTLKVEVDSLLVVYVREQEEQRIRDSIAGVKVDSIDLDNIKLLEESSKDKKRLKLIEPQTSQLP